MDAQNILNTVADHLFKQGRRSLKSERGRDTQKCVYRSPEGLSCAVGCLITDEEYTPKMDLGSSGVKDIAACDLLPERLVPHLKLLGSLQGLHDNEEWEGHPILLDQRLLMIADHYGLTYEPRNI